MLSGGFHSQTISNSFKESNTTTEKDISLFVFRAGAVVEGWHGKSQRHVVGVEVGYTYGKSEYSLPLVTNVGSVDSDVETNVFNMPQLHLRISYSFFIKKQQKWQ